MMPQLYAGTPTRMVPVNPSLTLPDSDGVIWVICAAVLSPNTLCSAGVPH